MAGEGDALHEACEPEEGEEENELAHDEEVVPEECAPEPAVPALPMLDTLRLVHANSSTSIAESVAQTLIETPSPRKAALLALPSTQLTPEPVSAPPRVQEVFLIADSPLKLVKAEPHEGDEEPQEHEEARPAIAMDRSSAMRELALLEAQLLMSQFCFRDVETA